MTAKKTELLYKFIKYILFFALFYVLHIAEVEGLHPFAFGMLFALVWCNQKIYIVAPLYVLSGLLVDFSWYSVIILCSCAVIFAIFYLLHLRLKKPLNHILVGFYAFLSQFAYLYLNSATTENCINACICVMVGLICLYAYLYFMQSLLMRGLRRRYTIDEVISAGVLLIAIGVGLSCLPDIHGIVVKALFIFFILLLVWVFNPSTSISFCVLLGVGGILSSNDLSLFLSITLCALVANLMKSSKKIFACAGIVLVDLFVNLYFFHSYDAYMLLAVLGGALLFMLIPQKSLDKLSNFVISDNDEFALRNIINRSRNTLYKRIWGVSEVFLEMQSVFTSMARGVLTGEQAVQYLTDEVKKNVCEQCVRKNNCLRADFKQKTEEIEKLTALAFARGKITMLDVPSELSSSCQRVNVLITSINNLVKEYTQYAQMVTGMDASRLLIGEQLFGVAQILRSLAEEVNLNITFDVTKEKRIIEELMYYHILCSEAVVYFKNREIKNVTLVVRKSDAERPEIYGVVSKILNCAMEVGNIQFADKPGFSVVTLRMVIGYDAVFGSAGVVKNGSVQSGDTHSVLRVTEDKILMALCDGMGSGESAEKVSTLALNLIENFYKAGFESSLILSSVNKLIALKGEESFSALDICVFDLRQCICDLVKLGSPLGFIKKNTGTTIIEAGALPLGILEDIKPNINSFALNDGDMVILITDGVLDAFGDYEGLQNFINDAQANNPQVLADSVMSEALQRCKNYAPDDMTVLVGKIWRKI